MGSFGVEPLLIPGDSGLADLTLVVVRRLEFARQGGVSNPPGNHCGRIGRVSFRRLTRNKWFLLGDPIEPEACYQVTVPPDLHPMGCNRIEPGVLIPASRRIWRLPMRAANYAYRKSAHPAGDEASIARCVGRLVG